jgi:hypothetical protein
MALDSQVVDEIHARLAIRYGAKWMNLWTGIPQEAVKADWAEQLSGLTPAGVRYALDNLPADAPPNVAQFRAMANRAPEYQPPALPAPPPSPKGLQRVADAISKATGRKLETVAEKAERCFARLRALRDAGRLSAGQRDFLQRAEAGMSPSAGERFMDFTAPPLHVLPPGMRAEAEDKGGAL